MTPSPISTDPQGSPGGLSDDECELRRLAEAATPGPWEWVGGPPEPFALKSNGKDGKAYQYVLHGESGRVYSEYSDDPDFIEVSIDDSAYIAAANPARVLALLDEIERMRESIRQLFDTRVMRTYPDCECPVCTAVADARAHLPPARTDEKGR